MKAGEGWTRGLRLGSLMGEDHKLLRWFVVGMVVYSILQWPRETGRLANQAMTEGWEWFTTATELVFEFMQGLFS